MWPTLFSIGPVSVHSFGIVLFLGVFFGGFKLWQRAKEEGWDETSVMDSWLLAGAVALIAGRLGFILSRFSEFGLNLYKALFLTKFPGLSGEGAWLGAAAVLLIIAWRQHLNFWPWIEATIPSLLTFEFFTHLATFLAGSNLGKSAPAGLGLNFPGVAGARWPVQLIWAAAIWLVYLAVGYWEKRYRSFNWKPGAAAAAYLILMGIFKMSLSFLEEQSVGIYWGLGFLLAGGLLLLVRSSINISAPRLSRPNNKRKRRFDYV